MANATETATAADPGPHAIFEFADLALDTRQRAVFRGLQCIVLPKLTYELLLALVEAAPGLLGRDELAERVWKGRMLTPETLSQRVLLLRRALGDDVDSSRYVRVVRGLGCQLVPPVRVHRHPHARPMPQAAAVDEAGDQAADIDLSLPAQPSIVILPFDTDGDAEHRNLARGLTHDITTRIARSCSFFVTARGSAFAFPAGPHDVHEVSRKLGVRYVVQGNVQFAGARMRIHAALADAVERREIWAESFQYKLGDVFEAQESITEMIVGAISSEIELAERNRALLETPASLDAWSAYHRGCWHMYRFNPADYEQAKQFFELSARLDPKLARTFAGLSFVHWQQAFFGIAADRDAEIQRTFDLAQHSVSLNPHDPLALWALGRARLLRGEVAGSLEELGASVALNPSFAVGQYTLGFTLMQAGDTVHSVERADMARRLSPYDPMSPVMIGVRAFSLALAGDCGQASKLMAVGTRHPNAHYILFAMAAVCDVLAGDKEAARRNFARARQARPGFGMGDFLRALQFQREAHVRLIGNAFRRLDRL